MALLSSLAALTAIALSPQPARFSPILSVQAWTFHRMTAFEAVTRTAEAGGKAIELFPGQKLGGDFPQESVGPNMSPAAMAAFKAHLEKHGVQPVAFGVTGIDPVVERARPLFAWAKAMGIGILNTESTNAIDAIETLAKEFDLRVGFHNHPRNNDPNYKVWDPNYVLSLVKHRDRRVGACADTGHWVRSGIKPVDALRILKGRVVSSHLKDLHEFARTGHDVPYGLGVSDVPGILRALRDMRFNGTVSVEYEYNWDRNVPEVAQCLGYLRGFLANNR